MLNYSKTIDHRKDLVAAETKDSKLAVIAKISFVVYLVYIFFGTQIPFQEKITDVKDIATANPINQVVVSFLFVVSILTLIPKRRDVFILIKKEKFLSLFLSWCLLSIVWSDFSFVSFKRLFQIIATVTISLAGLLNINDSEGILKYFKWVLGVYILLSIVSVFAVPGAKDPNFMTWRGLAPTKNHLGQSSLMCTLFWLYAFYTGSGRGRAIALIMMILSVTLLIGTQSATSILTLFIMSMIGLVFLIDDRFRSLGVGRLFSVMGTIVFMIIAILVLYLGPDLLIAIPAQMGKDTTFSGRTDLWLSILEEVKKHFLRGCGFGAFWVMENIDLQLLYRKFVWLPRQAHLGYLDILNETGLIGFVLFVAEIITYFLNLIHFKGHGVWKWIVMAVLVVNLMETTLFRPNILTGTLFLFSYLATYAEKTVWESLG